jgi:hypothetical protein
MKDFHRFRFILGRHFPLATICAQTLSLSTHGLQHRIQHLIDLDRANARLITDHAGLEATPLAFHRMIDHSVVSAIGKPFSRQISGAEDRHAYRPDCRREMHWPTIVSTKYACPLKGGRGFPDI